MALRRAHDRIFAGDIGGDELAAMGRDLGFRSAAARYHDRPMTGARQDADKFGGASIGRARIQDSGSPSSRSAPAP